MKLKTVPMLIGITIVLMITSTSIIIWLTSQYKQDEKAVASLSAENSSLRKRIYANEHSYDSLVIAIPFILNSYIQSGTKDKGNDFLKDLQDAVKSTQPVSESNQPSNLSNDYAFVEVWVDCNGSKNDQTDARKYVSNVFKVSSASSALAMAEDNAEKIVRNSTEYNCPSYSSMPMIHHYSSYEKASEERRNMMSKYQGVKSFDYGDQ